MASPAYHDTIAYAGGGWNSDRTLTNPSWPSDTRVFVVVRMDYLRTVRSASQDGWGGIPSSWTTYGGGPALSAAFGSSLQGISNVAHCVGYVWSCRPSEVAATIRPETGGSLFTPNVSATAWDVFLVGYRPSKLVGSTVQRSSGETSSSLPSGTAVPITGTGEGTIAQFSIIRNTTITGVATANGFTQDYSHGDVFAVASQQFASGLTTDPCVYTKAGTSSFRIGGTRMFALDTPDPGIATQRIGLGWMVA